MPAAETAIRCHLLGSRQASVTSQYRQGTNDKQHESQLVHFAAEMFARQRVAQLVQHFHQRRSPAAATARLRQSTSAVSSGRRPRNSSKWPTTSDPANSTTANDGQQSQRREQPAAAVVQCGEQARRDRRRESGSPSNCVQDSAQPRVRSRRRGPSSSWPWPAASLINRPARVQPAQEVPHGFGRDRLRRKLAGELAAATRRCSPAGAANPASAYSSAEN